MKDFFHGWRRKAGCIALVMACTLLSTWARSLIVHDKVSFCIGSTQNHLHSVSGGFRWQQHDLIILDLSDPTFNAWMTPENQWVSSSIEPTKLIGVDFHYLPIAEILFLLSVHLIVWSGRPAANRAESPMDSD